MVHCILRLLRKTGLCIFFAVFFLILLPATALAEDSSEQEPAAEDGSAYIGVVEDAGADVTTEPEIQQSLGMDDEDAIAFENTETDNAIQLAINAALANASGADSISSITIYVADGTYLGGLSISNENDAYDLAQDFVLQIMAEDAAGDDDTLTNSCGGVQVDGPVMIDKINVLLAGLYLVGTNVINAKNGNAELYGTSEDDAIDLNLADGATAQVAGGDGNDCISVTGEDSGEPATGPGQVAIDGGEGDDIITLDTSLTNATTADTTVLIDGGEGFDKLELTGALDSDATHTASRFGDDNDKATIAAGTTPSTTMNINAESVEAYTDTLENKNTVELTGSSVYQIDDVLDFTDYIIQNYLGGNVSILLPAGSSPFLSNLIFENDSLTLDSVNADELNILIKGQDITIDGNITGKNITIVTQDTDVQAEFSTDFNSSVIPDAAVEFSLFDFYTNASITINASARLFATETIKLISESTQTQPLVPDLTALKEKIEELEAVADDLGNPEHEQAQEKLDSLKALLINPNFVNVKVGSATITILGYLLAADISASASALTIMAVTNEDLAEWYIPLGVCVAAVEALVTVGGNASLTSTLGGVDLNAAAAVAVTTNSVTGAIPFSLALSVVVADAHVVVMNSAAISALSGDVVMHASGDVQVETISTSDEDPEEPASSGGYFAISIVLQDVAAAALGNASIAANSISLTSDANEVVVTHALSNNEAAEQETEPGEEEESDFSLTDIIQLIIGLFDQLTDDSEPMVSEEGCNGVDDAKDQLSPSGEEDEDDLGLNNLFHEEDGNEEDDEDLGLAGLFDEGTAGAGGQEGASNSSSQIVGALAVTYASNLNNAAIVTGGNILSGGALALEANALQTITTVADGSPIEGQEPGDPASTAIGIGVGVGVVDYSNTAYLQAGAAACSDISVVANSEDVSSDTEAIAGMSECNIGIAGAVAVQIVSALTNARIGSDVTVDGGDVVVAASQSSNFTTIANAMSDDGADKLGVGAGIVIAIIGVDVNAVIEDSAEILMPDGVSQLGSLEITAAYTAQESASAAAGATATGGVAAVPVLSLVVSGASTNAALGAGNNELSFSGDAIIDASSSITRALDADAAAAGSSVAVGGAFAISITNDNASAKLRRSVAARNVTVRSSSTSAVTLAAQAGANGATESEEAEDASGDPAGDGEGEGEEDGEADQLADKNIEAAGTLAGQSNTNNVNTEAVSSLSANRQKAQTSEGNVSVAAGFALNIQNNTAESIISDGLEIEAIETAEDEVSGEVLVLSINKTDADISANASAVGSDTGVGVAVAINMVTYENIAEIGNTAVSCAALTVMAMMPEEDTEEAAGEENEEEPQDNSLNGILTRIITEYVMDAVSTVSFAADFSDQIEGLVTEILGILLTELQADTGVEGLFQNDLTTLLSEKLDDLAGIPATELEHAKTAIIDELQARLEKLLAGEDYTEFDTAALNEALRDEAKAIVDELTADLVNIEQLRDFLKSDIADAVKEKLTNIIQASGSAAMNNALALLKGWIGEDAEALYGHTIATESIAGAGASDVGVAGSVAITLLTAKTTATIAASTALVERDIVVAGDTLISANAVNIISTVASSAVGADGKADENKAAAENANGASTGGSTTPATDVSEDSYDAAGTGADAQAAQVSSPNTSYNGASVGVGAAFALNCLTIDVDAGIDAYRKLETGTLNILAKNRNKIDTIAVSGTDPFASEEPGETEAAKIAVDAAVAVAIVETSVNASVASNTRLVTDGGNTLNIADSDVETVSLEELVNVHISAEEYGQTHVKASGFTVGGKAAVGAAVAVNIVESNATAAFEGSGAINGALKVAATTYNEDDCHAIATAMGAKAQRYADKLKATLDSGEDQVNAVADGNYGDDSEADNETLEEINGNLDAHENSEQDGAPSTNQNASLSANVLSSQDASTESSPDQSEGEAAADRSGSSANLSGSSTVSKTKIRIAAAVALNITEHIAQATVRGDIASADVQVLAENKGNFNTLATGAAISLDSGNSIGLGVAISLNENQSNASAGGTLACDGDITVDADLSQNMDGKYAGLLGAQALGGAVSGDGSKLSIAGAVAIIVSKSQTAAGVLASSTMTCEELSISAKDKSKLAVRAGALSAGGASVGVGVSFALIYAHNAVYSEIISATTATPTQITADSLSLSARKIKVDYEDYNLSFDKSTVASVEENSGWEDEELDDEDENDEVDVYNIDITFDTDTILETVNLLNFLSSTNYYIEAISGAINTGTNSKFAASGSFAMMFFYNDTRAQIGNNINITISDGPDSTHDVTVQASSDTTARIIAGAVVAGASKVGVGITVGLIDNADTVYARIGELGISTSTLSNTGISTAGQVNVGASSTLDLLLITVAVSATSGSALGGSVSLLLTENDVQATIGDYCTITAANGVSVLAANDVYEWLVALSAAVSGGKVAAGGTVAVIITKNSTLAAVGSNTDIQATDGSVEIAASNQEELYAILASLSGSTGSVGVAGTVNVQLTESSTEARVGNETEITAGCNIAINADSDTWMMGVMAAVTASSSVAVGAAINVNLFNRNAKALVGEKSKLDAGGNIIIQAAAKDWLLTVVAAGAASGNTGIAGSIPVMIGESHIEASVQDETMLLADGTIAVNANLMSHIIVPAIAIAVGGTAGVGATVVVLILKNVILAVLENGCALDAGGTMAATVVSGGTTEEKHGVFVQAKGLQSIIMVAVSGAAGGTAAVAGAVTTLLLNNLIEARLGRNGGAKETKVDAQGDIQVSAEDDVDIIDLAGGIAIGGTAGVGVTAVVLLFDSQVSAQICDDVKMAADGNVLVNAKATDDLWMFSIAFAVSGTAGVGVDANVVLFSNNVFAAIGGSVSSTGKIDVRATSDIEFDSMGVGMGIGATAGAVAVVIITYFKSETIAKVYAAAVLSANSEITILAKSNEYLFATGAGAAGGATAGVAGTVNVIFVEVMTQAITESSVSISGASVSLLADDHYEILGVVGTFAGGGVAGVGISALVGLVYSTVTAQVGENNTISATSGGVNIRAISTRKFDAYCITCGVGGTAGISVAVAIVIAGGKLSDDTSSLFHPDPDADGDGYGDNEEKDAGTDPNDDSDHPEEEKTGNGHFDMQSYIDDTFGKNGGQSDIQGYKGEVAIGSKLDSDGTKAEDYGVDVDGDNDLDGDGEIEEDSKEDGKGFGETEPEDDLTEEEQQQAAQDQADEDTNALINSNPAPQYDPMDAVTAVVMSGSVIESGGTITILAHDSLQVDMVTGALGVGVGGVGVGIGVGIAILNSNVIAQVEQGARLGAAGDISITATGGIEDFVGPGVASDKKKEMYEQSGTTNADGSFTVSGSNDDNDDEDHEQEDRDNDTKDTKGEDTIIDFANAGTKIITVTIGGGVVGIAVSVAVLIMQTQTHAIMSGDVYRIDGNGTHVAGADHLTVTANSNFGTVLTLTLGVAAGFGAVSATVALSLYQADVSSCIADDAEIIALGTVSVLANSDSIVQAIATALGGGVVAINAGAAIAINRTRVDTFIGQGVKLTANNVLVASDITTGASAIILAVAIGVGAINVTCTVAILNPTVLTYIGVTPYGLAFAGSAGTGGSIHAANNVTVENSAVGNAYCLTVAIAAGGIAGNGAVGVSVNKIIGYAAINKTSVSAKNIYVIAVMNGDATIKAYGLVLGFIAGGIIVAVANISAENVALIDVTNSNVTATNDIYVGTQDPNGSITRYASTAYVDLKTAAVGAAAISVNIAFANNKSINKAIVRGSGALTADTLEIEADGWTVTHVKIAGISAGGLVISVSVSLSILQSQQEASLSGSGTYTLNNLSVVSKQNYGKSSGFDAWSEIFSGGGGLVCVMGQIGIIIANATGIASAGAASLTVTGNIQVKSLARSYTDVLLAKTNISAVSIGVIYARAEAQGLFVARLDAANAQISAENIDVITEYTAHSTTDLTPADGGVSASLLNIAGNTGKATISTVASAEVINTGTVTYSGDFTVKVAGQVYAYAVVRGTTVALGVANIAVNIVQATLIAAQKACIENAHIISAQDTTGTLSVLSHYNRSNDWGATANVGENNGDGSVTISMLGGSVNTAAALSNSAAFAYMRGVTTDIGGDIIVENESHSYAAADIVMPNANVGLVSIAANITTANASGTYEAYLDSTGSLLGIKARNITVSTDYTADAITQIGSIGAAAEVNLVGVDINYAISNCQASANSYLKGSGLICADKAILISTTGDGLAEAYVKTALVSVSLVSIKTNETQATFNAQQSAYMDIAGEVSAHDGIEIASVFNEYNHENAKATSGNNLSVSVSLASIKDSKSTAATRTTNKAYITGTGNINITSGSLEIAANTKTYSYSSVAEGTSIAAIAWGGNEVYAYTGDDTEAYITGGIAIDVSNDVTVIATSFSRASAIVRKGFSLNLISCDTVKALAEIGHVAQALRQTVKAFVGEDTTIRAGRDIIIMAHNMGTPLTKVDLGTNVGALEISVIVIQASHYYTTEAGVGNNSALTAGRDIRITATNIATANTKAEAVSVGLLAAISIYYAYNLVGQITNVTIGNYVSMAAARHIEILASTNAEIIALTDFSSIGLAGVTELITRNEIIRETNLIVGTHSSFEADEGNITICASAGTADTIVTISRGFGAGVVGVAEGEARTSITSNCHTIIGAGTQIVNTFGTVTIEANTGVGHLDSVIFVDSGGIVGSTDAFSHVNNLVLNADVIIGSSTGSRVSIAARNINIYALLKNIYVYSSSNTTVSGAGGEADSVSMLTLSSTIKTDIFRAELRAYDTMRILSSTNPSGQIVLLAFATINAIAGHLDVTACFNEYTSSILNIFEGAVLYGAHVDIDAYILSCPVFMIANGTRNAIATETESRLWYRHVARTLDVNPAVEFHIGDAAAGIVIAISANGTVRAVGIAGERTIWTIGDPISFIQDLTNAAPGYLRVNGALNGNIIHTQEYIPYITIINRSSLAISLAGADLYNDTFANPTITIAGGSYHLVGKEADETTPCIPEQTINITSYQGTDVTIGYGDRPLLNETGTTNIVWIDQDTTDDDPGSGSLYGNAGQLANLPVAILWTHKLNIMNAANIGNDAFDRFQVYLVKKGASAPDISIDATGDVYVSLALAEVEMASELPAQMNTTQFDMDLTLRNIKTTGKLDLLLELDARITYLAGAAGLMIVFPGLVMYTDDAYALVSGRTYTIDELARYQAGYNPADQSLAYELPDGTKIYTDAYGKVVRVLEDALAEASNDYDDNVAGIHDLSNYAYSIVGSDVIITLVNENISINLTTGEITVLENTVNEGGENAFSAYLAYNYNTGCVYLNYETFSGEWQITDVAKVEVKRLYTMITTVVDAGGIITDIHYDATFGARAATPWVSITQLDYYIINGSYGIEWNPGISEYGIIVVANTDFYHSESGKYYVAGEVFAAYTSTRQTLDYRSDNYEETYTDLEGEDDRQDNEAGAGSYRVKYFVGNIDNAELYIYYYEYKNNYVPYDQYYVVDFRIPDEDGDYDDALHLQYTYASNSAGFRFVAQNETNADRLGGYEEKMFIWAATNLFIAAYDAAKNEVFIRISRMPLYQQPGCTVIPLQDQTIVKNEGKDDEETIEFYGYDFGNGLYVQHQHEYRYYDDETSEEYSLIELNEGADVYDFQGRIKVYNLKDGAVKLLQGDSMRLKKATFNEVEGYIVKKDLFIGTDGTLYFNFNYAGASTTLNGLATYDIDLNGGTYSDRSICIQNCLNPESTTIQIIAPIRYEMLSEHVARDCSGQYHFLDNNQWHDATYTSGDIGAISTLVGWNAGAMSEANEVKNASGDVLLTIIVDTDGIVYYLVSAGEDLMVLLGGDGSVRYIGTGEVAQKTEIGKQSYLLGELAGSEVIIRMEDPNGSILDDDLDGSTDITASLSVTFMADSLTGSIGTDNNKLDIVSPIINTYDKTGADVVSIDTFITVTGDSVINEGEPLLVNGAHLQIICIDGDLYYGTISATDNAIGDGALLEFNVTNGRILPTNLHPDDQMNIVNGKIVLLNSTADFKATGDIVLNHFEGTNSEFLMQSTAGSVLTYANENDALEDGYIDLDQTTCTILAQNDISYITWGIFNNSTFTASAASGNVTAVNAESRIEVQNATAIITAHGDITYHELDVIDGSTFTATSSNGGFYLVDVDSYINVQDSAATIQAYGDITYHELDVIDGSTFTATSSNGGVRPVDADSYIKIDTLSQADVRAELDIVYHLTDVYAGSAIALRSAGGNIIPFNSDSRVIIHDDDCAITLSALYDIGYAHMHLLLDIPQAVPLMIEHVRNYWINAVHFPLAVDPALGAVYGGIDENGDEIQNDSPISNEFISFIELQEVIEEYDDITDTEWAAIFVDGMSRIEWLTLVASGNIANLIRGQQINAELLGTWLEDETITEEVVAGYLAALNDLAPGDPDYDAAAQWLSDMETGLRQAIVDKQSPLPPVDPNEPEPFEITNAMAAEILAMLLGEDAVGRIDDPSGIVTPEIWDAFIGAIVDQILQKIAIAADAYADPDEEDPRDLSIDLQESTGAAYVINEGNITITQHNGDMTLDRIDSTREDVTLTNLGGSILSIANPNHTIIEARDITLNASGSIGSAAQPLLIDQMTNDAVMVANILDAYLDLMNVVVTADDPLTELDETVEYIKGMITGSVRFDWIRVFDEFVPTNLNATATTGGIYLVEVNGVLGLNTLTAGTDIVVRANSVSDTRAISDANNIITAGGDVTIEVVAGGIGTADDYYHTAVGGAITITAPEDIFITDTANMNLTVTTQGHVNAEAESDLTLANTSGDLLLGFIGAGGMADITSQGAILEGERRAHSVTLEAEGIALHANGVIGTYENPFEIDIGAGTFSATADQLIVDELDSTIYLSAIDVSGDVKITTPGSIYDMNGTAFNDALAAQRNANELQSVATQAQTTASVLQDYADRIKAIIDAGDAAAQDAQDALDQTIQQIAALTALLATGTLDAAAAAELNKQLIALQKDIPQLESARDDAIAARLALHLLYDSPLAQAQAEADAAKLAANVLQDIANTAQAQADALKQIADATPTTVRAGGDLTMLAGGSIGEVGHGLSVHVDGDVTLEANETISIAGGTALRIAGIAAANDIQVAMLGSITAASGANTPVICGQSLDIGAIWFDIGEKVNPLHVRIAQLSAIGENIYLYNEGPLAIEQVNVRENAELHATGAVISGGSGVNITAQNLVLTAGGAIGSTTSPLKIDVGLLSMTGDDIDINNISQTLDINKLTGRHVSIGASGNVTGSGLKATTLCIDAFGSVGSINAPLRINVSRSVEITSAMGSVHFINTYRPEDTHYLSLLILKLHSMLRLGGQESPIAVYLAIGIRANGEWEVLGMWASVISTPATADAMDGTPPDHGTIGATILADLAALGYEFDIALVDGLEGFGDAASEAYPETKIQSYLPVWLSNKGMQIDQTDHEAFFADVDAIYAADTLQAAQEAYKRFYAAWGAAYPDAAAQLECNWHDWCEDFDTANALNESGCDISVIVEGAKQLADSVCNNDRYWNEFDQKQLFFIQILEEIN